MPLIGARAMRERMIAAGLTTAEEIDRLIEGVEIAVNDPERVQITFTLVQVWGAKPSTRLCQALTSRATRYERIYEMWPVASQ